MSLLGEMINPENIIFFPNEIKLKEEALDKLSLLMLKNGYVIESYIEAIKDREIAFPTGLNTTTLGIAIPHVDSHHVKEATIALGILKEPVEFQEMGAEDMTVPVRIIFMLAIKDPTKQLDVLQAVITLIENGTKIDDLAQADNAEDVLKILR